MLKRNIAQFVLPRRALSSVRLVSRRGLHHWRVRLPSSTRVFSPAIESSHTRQLTMSLNRCASSNTHINSTKVEDGSWWFPEHDVSLSSIVKSMREPHLRKGDDPWGFVIYRCSYGDDEAWKQMIDLIKYELKGKAKDATHCSHDGEGWDDLEVQDLLPRHELTLIEDRNKFDGATSHEVRDHFIQWVKEELSQKRLLNAPEEFHRALENCPPDGIGPENGLGPRYNFCLFVDDICLESLDKMSYPVVKILWKRWGRREPNDRQYDIHPDWEDGETDIDEEDVGWMYIPVAEYFAYYDMFEEDWQWYDSYLRPPYMLHSDPPGFWRKTSWQQRSEASGTPENTKS